MAEGSKYVKLIWLDSMATERIIEQVCKIQTLQELRITHCSYVTGEFLKQLKSTSLQRLDFEGSLYILFDEIRFCIGMNKKTLNKLSIDGENLKAQELN